MVVVRQMLTLILLKVLTKNNERSKFMKKIINKLLSLFLAITICLSLSVTPVIANASQNQGSCGSGSYSFDEDTGILTLYGKHIDDNPTIPFCNYNIKKIIINDDVEKITTYSLFDGCDNVTEIIIGENFTTNEILAISLLPQLSNLEKITVNTINAETVDGFPFIEVSSLPKLKQVIIGDKVRRIGSYFLCDMSLIDAEIETTNSCLIEEITIPSSVIEIDDCAIIVSSINTVIIENPKCTIIDDKVYDMGLDKTKYCGVVISNGVTPEENLDGCYVVSGYYNGIIYSYGDNSTAKQYCDKYNYNYINLDENHNWTFVNTINATCSNIGYDLYQCEDCGITKKVNIVDVAPHQLVVKDVIAPTCQHGGYTLYECSVCSKTITDDIVDKIGHNYDIVYNYDDYYEYRKCTMCNRVIERKHNVSVNEHSVIKQVTIDGKKMSCLIIIKEGICRTCDYSSVISSSLYDKYDEHLLIPLDETRVWQLIDFTPSTCTSLAVYHYYNENEATSDLYINGDNYKPHIFIKENTVLPTCTQKGYTWATCEECGEIYTYNYVNKLEHDYKLTEQGEEHSVYICERCGEKHLQPLITNIITVYADVYADGTGSDIIDMNSITDTMNDMITNVVINGKPTEITKKTHLDGNVCYEIKYTTTLIDDTISFEVGSNNYEVGDCVHDYYDRYIYEWNDEMPSIDDVHKKIQVEENNGKYSFNVSNIDCVTTYREYAHNIQLPIKPLGVYATMNIYDTFGKLLYSQTNKMYMGMEYDIYAPSLTELVTDDEYAVLNIQVEDVNGTNIFKPNNNENNDYWLGTFTANDNNITITVTVISMTKTMQVITNYIDKQGNKLAESEIFEGKAFDEYETVKKDINGYVLTEVSGNAKGKITEDVIVVNYIYDKNILPSTSVSTDEISSPASIEVIDTGDYINYSIIFIGSVVSVLCLVLFVIIKKDKKEVNNNDC